MVNMFILKVVKDHFRLTFFFFFNPTTGGSGFKKENPIGKLPVGYILNRLAVYAGSDFHGMHHTKCYTKLREKDKLNDRFINVEVELTSEM